MKTQALKAPGLLFLALLATLSACDSNSFQVIEDLDFAPSLDVDLSRMEMLPSGVYIEDLVVGDGDTVLRDSEVIVSFLGFLADGSQFGTGVFTFIMGQRGVIAGFEQGVLGMRERGRRKIIIPPDLGYGEQDQDAIPAGSVLIFDITVDSIPIDTTGGVIPSR
jgi:FKBP-type peptidyl-prolyl cis-trans isomerase FkpA